MLSSLLDVRVDVQRDNEYPRVKRKSATAKLKVFIAILIIGFGCALGVWGIVKLFPKGDPPDPDPPSLGYEPARGLKTKLAKEVKTTAIGTRIVGGHKSIPHAHPHQVSLQVKSGDGYYHICGGSLVAEDKVVLAAHCVYNEDPLNHRIVAGDHDLFDASGTEQTADIHNFVIHPNYNPVTVDYDYAVAYLKMDQQLKLDETVQPIPLAERDVEATGICINSGWGNTLTNGEMHHPGELQEVALNVLLRPDCLILYTGINNVTERMICAGGPSKGPCSEDSGGPLVCEDGSHKYLAGLVSWGMTPCGQYPGVFANVALVRDWLDSA